MILTELAKVKVAELLDRYKAESPDKDIFLKIDYYDNYLYRLNSNHIGKSIYIFRVYF